MSRLIFSILLFLLLSCSGSQIKKASSDNIVTFYLDLNESTDDLFHVTAAVPPLTAANNVYNFVSTAPGTYSILDFGRYVKSFSAFDQAGNEIKTEKISTNRWQFSSPEKVTKITYTIEDGFDPEDKTNLIFQMGSTDIDTDHVMFNTFGVFGYIEGMQGTPIRLKLDYNPNWMIGTALNKDQDGYYYASNYDHLADSPIIVGEMTKASTRAGGMDIEVFSYSTNDSIKAMDILNASEDILNAASKFISYAPVPRYSFLFSFLDPKLMFDKYGFQGYGALEHSYSSLYVMPESPVNMTQIRDFMAHEFFHVITPLNIHSEVIGTYNFSEPIASEHLWLYEGVTQWASDIMQMRAGQIDLENYLNRVSQNITNDQNRFDLDFSLSKLSLESYEPSGSKQYGNVYQRGAFVAALFDIRLLDLSNGTSGLRELIIKLSKKYGKDRSFPEKSFFKVLEDMTYPEIKEFLNNTIKNGQPFPIEENFKKIGINYTAERLSSDERPLLGISAGSPDGQIIMIFRFSKAHKDFGLKNRDQIVSLFGKEVTAQTYRTVLQEMAKYKVGDEYEIVVKRGDKEIPLKGKFVHRMDYNVLEANPDATAAQLKLRTAWMKNLPTQ